MKRFIFLFILVPVLVYSQTAERMTSMRHKQNSWTGSILTIDYGHWEVHEGGHFGVHSYASLGSGDTAMVSIDVPDSLNGAPTVKNIHLVWNLDAAAGAAIFTVYEVKSDTGAVAGGGTLIVTHNNNRAYKGTTADSSYAVWRLTPTISAYGTTLWAKRIGTTGGQSQGGVQNHENELILRPGYTYLFKMESAAASNFINYAFDWYEHTPIILQPSP